MGTAVQDGGFSTARSLSSNETASTTIKVDDD